MYAQMNQLKLCYQESKQTSKRKICNFTGNRDHLNKK